MDKCKPANVAVFQQNFIIQKDFGQFLVCKALNWNMSNISKDGQVLLPVFLPTNSVTWC